MSQDFLRQLFFGEFAEGFEGFFEGLGPGGAAVEANALAVFLFCGEEGAGGDGNAGGEGLVWGGLWSYECTRVPCPVTGPRVTSWGDALDGWRPARAEIALPERAGADRAAEGCDDHLAGAGREFVVTRPGQVVIQALTREASLAG